MQKEARILNPGFFQTVEKVGLPQKKLFINEKVPVKSLSLRESCREVTERVKASQPLLSAKMSLAVP